MEDNSTKIQDLFLYHQGNTVPWHQLLEAPFIERVFEEIKQIDSEFFERYNVHVYSNNGKRDTSFPVNKLDESGNHILFYLSDETGTIPEDLSPYFEHIFKCYLPVKDHANIHALPLGTKVCLPDNHQGYTKQYRVGFAGHLHYQRKELMEFLANHPLNVDGEGQFNAVKRHLPLDFTHLWHPSYIRFSHKFASVLEIENYKELLQTSQIALCPPGLYNTETFRHYEALACGNVPITLPVEAPWLEDAPFITINNWSEIPDKVEALEADPSYMDDIQSRAKAFWEEHLHPSKIATYILNMVSK